MIERFIDGILFEIRFSIDHDTNFRMVELWRYSDKEGGMIDCRVGARWDPEDPADTDLMNQWIDDKFLFHIRPFVQNYFKNKVPGTSFEFLKEHMSKVIQVKGMNFVRVEDNTEESENAS